MLSSFRVQGQDPPNPNFIPPSKTFHIGYEGNNAQFQALDDAEGKWGCGIDTDPQAGEIEVSRNFILCLLTL